MPRNIIVDHTRCNACHNHADHALNCSRRGSPEGNLLRARAKIAADIAVDAAKQQCPANICNHGFLFSIMDGEYGRALEMVRDKMLFARTCGDICHRPCELFSGLGAKAVPIKALKKFVSASDEDFFDFSAIEKRVQEAEKKDKKIAVIGAGPAGLSAAYDLVQAGYTVQVFEKENEAGGLIKSAIPDFRMDKAGLEHEVELLGKLGVRFSFGFTLGRDEKLEKIADEFDAVLIAIGLSRSKELPSLQAKIPEDLQSDAIKFLKTCGDGQNPLQPGSTVLVIGGGNSAMDAARMAARGNGKNKVTVSCIESRRDMPAFEEEIEKAIAEGIAIIPESFVHDCMISENGRQLQLLIRSCKDKKDIETLQADYVIFAIGQRGDKQHYVEMADASLDEEERIKADAKTGHTHYKNVFVAGDLCAENHTSVIGAIASGKRAANGIRQLLETYQYEYEGLDALSQLNTQTNYGSGTAELPEEDISRHIEQFNLFQACYQCNHCIDNFGCPAMIRKDGKIQIDQAKCTRCGLCIDVCPNDAIRWEEAKTLPEI